MTKARAAALAVLDAATEPLSASSVAARISVACDMATVYRALHHLEETGFAESFVLYCAEDGVERFYASAHTAHAALAAHRHWFHCESCHRFVDLGACRIGGLVAEVEQELDLHVTKHTMYFSGICGDCSKRSTPTTRTSP